MGLAMQGVLIGVIATIGMDIWAAVLKYVLRLPTTDWAMVGRWLGHMPRRVFVHRAIDLDSAQASRDRRFPDPRIRQVRKDTQLSHRRIRRYSE